MISAVRGIAAENLDDAKTLWVLRHQNKAAPCTLPVEPMYRAVMVRSLMSLRVDLTVTSWWPPKGKATWSRCQSSVRPVRYSNGLAPSNAVEGIQLTRLVQNSTLAIRRERHSLYGRLCWIHRRRDLTVRILRSASWTWSPEARGCSLIPIRLSVGSRALMALSPST